jgi:putative transcriptional regulator
MTQREVASRVGINRTTYTNIENYRRNPSYLIAIKIKKVLGYKEDDLFDMVKDELGGIDIK